MLPVVGDGNALPLADGQYDLVSYAQSFHWTDPERALAEAFRVLKPGALFAAWWNRHDTSVPWFARHQERLFAACDWSGHVDESWLATTLAGPPWDRHVATVEVPWSRRMSVVDFGRNLIPSPTSSAWAKRLQTWSPPRWTTCCASTPTATSTSRSRRTP